MMEFITSVSCMYLQTIILQILTICHLIEETTHSTYDRPVYILLSLMISRLIYMGRIQYQSSIRNMNDELLQSYEVTKRS